MEDTLTFLGVRFYIDFEVSLVDKTFKGFGDCAIIIRSCKGERDIVILRSFFATVLPHMVGKLRPSMIDATVKIIL